MADDQVTQESRPDEYDKVVITKNTETVGAFSSHVIPMKAYMGECINVMTQVLQSEDGSLLQGLTVQNTYIEMRKGSKNSVVVVRNSSAYPPHDVFSLDPTELDCTHSTEHIIKVTDDTPFQE